MIPLVNSQTLFKMFNNFIFNEYGKLFIMFIIPNERLLSMGFYLFGYYKKMKF